jgi:hypothetical protein
MTGGRSAAAAARLPSCGIAARGDSSSVCLLSNEKRVIRIAMFKDQGSRETRKARHHPLPPLWGLTYHARNSIIGGGGPCVQRRNVCQRRQRQQATTPADGGRPPIHADIVGRRFFFVCLCRRGRAGLDWCAERRGMAPDPSCTKYKTRTSLSCAALVGCDGGSITRGVGAGRFHETLP